ncbi:DGQHR domain-containing protein, partial [bacterium]|nr:DGQHR domain-containing protein [bacterium]
MADNDEKQLLHPLLIAPSDPETPSPLIAEFRKRNKIYNFRSVSRKNLEKYYEEGWEYDRRLKKKTRIKQLKGFDEQLENEVWCFFYKMGYPEMNEGRQFIVRFERRGQIIDEQQIDVFAKDDETVVFIECKASEKLKQRRLQNDIEAFANKKKYFATSVRKHYGEDFKPKILWLFITKNIRWSRIDKDRAESEKIQIITDREFRYFNEIVKHLGPAAKYQFLAEFFKDQKIPELKNTIVPAIRGKLGGKHVYCFVTTPKQLLKIAFVNHRALDDPEGYPTYQRLVDKTRRKNIGAYLENGGFFPTNLLINFSKKVRFDPQVKDEENDIHYGQLYLPDRYKSAWIIDGQHRLYGYSDLDEKFLKQNIMVLAFEKLPRVEEANLFVTINHEQRSVPRNLLDDLEGDLKWGSDKPTERIGAIAARLIKILNGDLGEPFHNRVTAQGIRATDQMCLTVPEIKDGLKKSGLVGTATMKRKFYEPGPLCEANDESTLYRARITLNLYFSLIKDANQKRWEMGRQGFLCTNFGIRGYLKLLASLIEFIEKRKKIDAKGLDPVDLIGEIEEYLEPVIIYISGASDSEFKKLFKVKYGSGGAPQYYFKLVQLVNEEVPEFSPEGYDDYVQSQSEEKIKRADGIVKELQTIIPAYIFNKFKEIYPGEDYLEKGVSNVEMRTKAYKKQQSEDSSIRSPKLETYFEFIEL